MKRADILHAAETCVCGKREQDYGSPENNFEVIAGFWTVYKGVPFTPNDVAMMMALLKVARIKSGGGTVDSFVDLGRLCSLRWRTRHGGSCQVRSRGRQ